MANKKLQIAKTLRANGVLGTIKTHVTGGGSYNPGTGRIEARGDESADSVRAMVLLDQLTKIPNRAYGSAGAGYEVNSLVEGVQKWALVDATSRPPKMQDHLVVEDQEWYVLNVQTISDKSGPVLYILALKR